MVGLIYIYNILGDNIQRNILENDSKDEDYQRIEAVDEEDIRYSSYAYIGNNPVAVQLIKKDETYQLKVNQKF